MKIQIIFGSTREGRKGEMIFRWIGDLAKQRKDFETELIDLRDWELPFLNDPKNPSSGEYSYDYTKKWSAKVAEADGYIIVTPEYNFGYPAVLKNALDLLYKEWNGKPVAFVSYGASAGGSRAVEQLKQVALGLKMLPIYEAVHIVRFYKAFDEQGNLTEIFYNDIANKLLDSLTSWIKK